jgi:protein ImuB
MSRRIACIVLPDIRLEIARESESQSPLVVIAACPGGAVKRERDVLGNTRIDFVSREAGAFGVRAGQTVAVARAKCAELRVRVVPNAIVHTTLARIAEATLAFGPTTAFDLARDVVWVDIGGCAHLHGGEIELARALGAEVHALGHASQIAVADGPRVAAAVARFSTRRRSFPPRSIPVEPVVVPEGQGATAVHSLPIAALDLDDDVSAWLADLGLTTCGDLQKLPRRALGMRLGERVHDIMQLLDGRDHAPLEAWRPPDVPEERVELDWGAHSTETLAFVFKTLCDRLAARLHGRAMAAVRLELVLALDRALLCAPVVHPPPTEPETCRHRLVLSMALPSPIDRASDLLSIVRARLEGCSLPAPVLAVTLRAPELARVAARTLDLLAPEPKAHRALPRLVAELTAELGESVVGTLALVDTWSPAERTRLMPLDGASLAAGSHTAGGVSAAKPFLVTSSLEPSRLIHAASISHAALDCSQHLARFEAVEWWRQPVQRGDLFAAWVDGALAWVELSAHRGACPLLRGWID